MGETDYFEFDDGEFEFNSINIHLHKTSKEASNSEKKSIARLLQENRYKDPEIQRKRLKSAAWGLPFHLRDSFLEFVFDLTDEKVNSFYDSLASQVFAERIPENVDEYRIPTFHPCVSLDSIGMVNQIPQEKKTNLRIMLILLAKQYQGYLSFSPTLVPVLAVLLQRYPFKEVLYVAGRLLERTRERKMSASVRWHFPFNSSVHRAVVNGFVETLRTFRWGKSLANKLRLKGINLYEIVNEWLCNFFWGYFSASTIEHFVYIFSLSGIKFLYRVSLILCLKAKKKLTTAQDKEDAKSIFKIVAADSELNYVKFMKRVTGIYLPSRKIGFASQIWNASLVGEGNFIYFPRVITESQILRASHFSLIWDKLPKMYRSYDLTQIFSTEKHGVALTTMYAKCEGIPKILLIIKDGRDSVFGFFLNRELRPTMEKFVSGGEGSFVFSYTDTFKFYSIIGDHGDRLLAAGKEFFGIGGGGRGMAVSIHNDLTSGMTRQSDTFGNPPLTNDGSTEFISKIVEIYSLK